MTPLPHNTAVGRILAIACCSVVVTVASACAGAGRSSFGERFKFTCPAGTQRTLLVINSSGVLADLFGARYGTRDRPTYIGSVSPGRRGEFVVGDSVMVSTQDPSGSGAEQPPPGAMRYEYECR